MRTRIKICGITRTEDALAATRLGADAIGLVFYPPSPRSVSPEQAQRIVKSLPPFVTVVGLFVNEDRAVIEQILKQVPLDLLQFHGDESAEDCRGFGRPWIKAIRMRQETDLLSLKQQYADASGLLLDTYQAGVPGGTGKTFDWDLVPQSLAGRIVLAGGLNSENVTKAVESLHPYAVDVSGGVEAAKGIKDEAKIEAFIAGVMRGDND
ncbi:MAG: phosphoribosylanthranilate isomerase [Candidatus Thiodiazotropha lotti]|uniref:N-(5'-phosphoribosyl)anthranilate isomerase n=1 Tax=Candidatus Thiodiazotropha lotti TaxID=2792787 RepID=A0A9E4K3B0_9GAMM|nr:phosphoribosylanthranilate isomerase [Candidatus Thiodiazotropha lotti]ODC02070.1 N-(5'-phosphoribosyl)anthranilate isomerase [Candidatus Thiodiazotropha endoloripes]MCG7920395.1 phosphoribosylanthranilate isomerase [Candidatus Thiodiazotropha lotti]MCG7931363.1 phosphoribosylanthranilate isomerase [Candidatus Thiodiazotropha lotti]MCG7938650.1 phosphoribosylanthranilate isomerase [Candidatus Thiodiazotropha lotti]